MQLTALSSQAACHCFFTVRRVIRVEARRSTALLLTCTCFNQPTSSGMPVFLVCSPGEWIALGLSTGVVRIEGPGWGVDETIFETIICFGKDSSQFFRRFYL